MRIVVVLVNADPLAALVSLLTLLSPKSSQITDITQVVRLSYNGVCFATE